MTYIYILDVYIDLLTYGVFGVTADQRGSGYLLYAVVRVLRGLQTQSAHHRGQVVHPDRADHRQDDEATHRDFH